jgi:hypothetical protein
VAFVFGLLMVRKPSPLTPECTPGGSSNDCAKNLVVDPALVGGVGDVQAARGRQVVYPSTIAEVGGELERERERGATNFGFF